MVQELGGARELGIQNRGCDRMLRSGAPFFCAVPVPYVNTCVHTKFEANPCTWAPSRTVDVSRFRVGRRAATAGGDRVAAVRSPPLGGGHRLRSPPVAEAATAFADGSDRLLPGRRPPAVTASQRRRPYGYRTAATRSPPAVAKRSPPAAQL